MSAEISRNHKKFAFEDSQTKETLHVSIPEVIGNDYGTYTWPSAPVLGQYIWSNRNLVSGKIVLELGAGTSLSGIVATKSGASKVYFTDSARYPSSLFNCKQTFENCFKDCAAEVLELTWGEVGASLLQLGPVDIIIGSDCFYDTSDFNDLLMTVSYILDTNPSAEFWTAYQERSSDRNIGLLVKKWHLGGRRIPLEDFGADSTNLAGSGLPGSHSIHMYIISRSKR